MIRYQFKLDELIADEFWRRRLFVSPDSRRKFIRKHCRSIPIWYDSAGHQILRETSGYYIECQVQHELSRFKKHPEEYEGIYCELRYDHSDLWKRLDVITPECDLCLTRSPAQIAISCPIISCCLKCAGRINRIVNHRVKYWEWNENSDLVYLECQAATLRVARESMLKRQAA